MSYHCGVRRVCKLVKHVHWHRLPIQGDHAGRNWVCECDEHLRLEMLLYIANRHSGMVVDRNRFEVLLADELEADVGKHDQRDMSGHRFYASVLTRAQTKVLLQISEHHFNGPPAAVMQDDLVGGAHNIVRQQIGVGIFVLVLAKGMIGGKAVLKHTEPIPIFQHHQFGPMIQAGQIDQQRQCPQMPLRIRDERSRTVGGREGAHTPGLERQRCGRADPKCAMNLARTGNCGIVDQASSSQEVHMFL